MLTNKRTNKRTNKSTFNIYIYLKKLNEKLPILVKLFQKRSGMGLKKKIDV